MSINMSIQEIVDRLSIAMLKYTRTDNDMLEEIQTYERELRMYKDVEKYLHSLIEINGQIWDLEADIRQGKEEELGLEEVGRRAIKIRQLNKIRISIKNEMADKYGEGFKDIKVNHGSE